MTPQSVRDCVYDSDTWPDLLTNYDGLNMYYDASGNPTFHVEGLGLTWTQGRRLASAGYGSTPSVTYSYNGDGLRTKKTLSSGNYVEYHVLDGVYVGDTRVIGNSTYRTLYLYDDAGAVIGLQSNGTKYWFAKNLQGDVVGILSNSGTLLARYTYDPWGKLTSVKNASGVTITDASNIALRNPFRYRSYMYDDETGLYYVSSRYYDPEIGRFISPDTTDVLTATPMGLTDKNLYAYCDNNPVIRADHGGDFWHIVAGAAIGGLIGGISSIVGQAVSGQKINWAEVGVSAASGALTGAITAACPGMGAVATGIVHGVVGAGAHVATELVNGRTPTVAGTLAAGVTSGVLAGGTKAIGNAISSGKLEIGKIKGVRASEGYPGVRYKTNAGPAYSVELHSSHNGHTPHLQVNKWLYQYKGYEGQPYRFRSWHYEFFKPWKGVY